jgi:hemerythrin superfamily protein
MGSIFDREGKLKLTAPDALLHSHDEARAELARANMEGGQIAEAAMQVARLCLPHFEYEEKTVFPILALLPHLSPENLRAEMMHVLPLISEFRAAHQALNNHHRSILGAVEALLQAAHNQENREFIDFAYNLRDHESIEDEVIYPAVILIGDYLREKFAS